MRHARLRFALRRGGALVASLALLLAGTFLMTHLVPGDPARAGLSPQTPPSVIEARRDRLHLDEPFASQFAHFVGGVARGDLGVSFTSEQPVSEILSSRFPATLRLAGLAFIVSLLIAVPLGMAIAVLTWGGRRRRLDDVFAVSTGGLVAVPDFLLATALVALFGVTLDWLPIAGADGASAYVLPVIALAALPIAALARVARVETLQVLDQEYMRVARSKRLPPRLLYVRHALPNILAAILPIGGLLLSGLVAGTVVIENIFAWPGLGQAIVQAIIDKDYPLVQGTVLVLGAITLVANLVVDAVLIAVNPRSLLMEGRA
jgi:peptide/nickel transport system permease protein